jgi:hypothetical protein
VAGGGPIYWNCPNIRLESPDFLGPKIDRDAIKENSLIEFRIIIIMCGILSFCCALQVAGQWLSVMVAPAKSLIPIPDK